MNEDREDLRHKNKYATSLGFKKYHIQEIGPVYECGDCSSIVVDPRRHHCRTERIA